MKVSNMNFKKLLFWKKKPKKMWEPQNDEEYEYMRYYYNVNATYRIPPPEEVYPHEEMNKED
jgi:hypothetical protein